MESRWIQTLNSNVSAHKLIKSNVIVFSYSPLLYIHSCRSVHHTPTQANLSSGSILASQLGQHATVTHHPSLSPLAGRAKLSFELEQTLLWVFRRYCYKKQVIPVPQCRCSFILLFIHRRSQVFSVSWTCQFPFYIREITSRPVV